MLQIAPFLKGTFMGDIKAGAVVVTRFCRANTSTFGSYIDYIDRSEAKRQEMLSSYNLYNDYMDNPEKTTGLFTKDRDILNSTQKKDLKEIFRLAQDNGSLMWQTVISFDNRWLAEHGIYDAKNNVLDERKLKEIARGGVNRMLEKEHLESAIWSAAIHYNTDNVHVHIATVELIPQREIKDYVQYQEIEQGGKTVKVPLRDDRGNIITSKEYVGRFKQKSIEACKQYVVNEILQQRDQNLMINRIIRDQIVKQKKQMSISKDPELRDKFMELYEAMPDCKRSLWNYNNGKMAFLHDQIDDLSRAYLHKYHENEFQELQTLLLQQQNNYKEAYGNSGRDYASGKIEDLYTRLGNAILQEIKNFDKDTMSREQKATSPKEAGFIDQNSSRTYQRKNTVRDGKNKVEIEIDNLLPEDIVESYYYAWSDDYKEAKEALYKRDFHKAIVLLQKEAAKGHALALYDLGDIYKYGRGVSIDLELANEYYKKAFAGFMAIYERKDSGNAKTRYKEGYIQYRIGKCYDQAKGVDQNYAEAREWYEASIEENCSFAYFSLGSLYFYGNGVDKSYQKAEQYFLRTIELRENGFAEYKLGEIYSKGIDDEPNEIKAQERYAMAYRAFLQLEKENPDDNIAYRLGMMELNGIGTEINPEGARKHFEIAAELGNDLAKYQLAKLYLKDNDRESINRAIALLEESAELGKNSMAAYGLGKVYLDQDGMVYDPEKAEEWFLKADELENEYAAYSLGKMYMDEDLPCYDMEKAMKYLQKAGDQENEYAQYRLGKIYLTPGYEDIDLAEKWLKASAEQGNEYAQYAIGMFYLDGERKDIDLAEKWLLKAAEKGNDMALYQVGKIYLDPEKGKLDVDKGIQCLQEVANQGNEYAQISLGLVYFKGEVIKQDIKEARKWMTMAAEQGNEFAIRFLENLEADTSNEHMRKFLNQRTGKIAAFALNKALNSLKKNLNNEVEQWRNQMEHEKLQQKEQAQEFGYHEQEYDDE